MKIQLEGSIANLHSTLKLPAWRIKPPIDIVVSQRVIQRFPRKQRGWIERGKGCDSATSAVALMCPIAISRGDFPGGIDSARFAILAAARPKRRKKLIVASPGARNRTRFIKARIFRRRAIHCRTAIIPARIPPGEYRNSMGSRRWEAAAI